MKLVLFDIDGTLLWPNGAGALALRRALTQVYGTAGALEQIYLPGMTDRSIIQQALSAEGISLFDIERQWAVLTQTIADHMKATVVECGVAVCPGVPALLDAMSTRPDILLGLVTGNLENTAPIKLQAAGIDPTLFRVGGYGSDHSDRNQLPLIAARRAEALTGRPFEGRDIVVVGDTPADIACARAVGGRAVAVATGTPSAAILQAAQPDVLLSDLSDLERALAAILPNGARE